MNPENNRSDKSIPAPEAKSPRIYGFETDPTQPERHPQRLLSFPADHPEEITVEAEFTDVNILAAAYHEGTYFLMLTDDFITPSKFATYDLPTRTLCELTTYTLADDASDLVVYDMTYDPTDGHLYAAAASIRGGRIIGNKLTAPFALYRIDIATGAATIVGLFKDAAITILGAADGGLYGVDDAGSVWIVDKTDGHAEAIAAETGIVSEGRQSMSCDKATGRLYWVACSATGDGDRPASVSLIRLSKEESGRLAVADLGAAAGNIPLTGLYIDSDPLDRDAPSGVSGLTVTAAPGSQRRATLSWVNPTMSIGGTPLSESLTLTVCRDGQEVATLTGTPGAAMTWDDTATGDDMHVYILRPAVNGLEGRPEFTEEIFTGIDIPGIPAEVIARSKGKGFAIEVTWTPPERGANGGWYDPEEQLHYHVTRYPDGKVVAEDTTDTSLTDEDITTQEGYRYGVRVIAGKGELGPEALSNVVVGGPALAPPYAMTLTPEDENLWTVIDGDNDGRGWYVHRTGWGGTSEPFFRYHPDDRLNPRAKTKEWLISPAFALKAGKTYTISYELRLLGSLFPANTAIYIGPKPVATALKTCIANFEGEKNDTAWTPHTVSFTIDTDGTYHIGFLVANRSPVQLYRFTLT